MNEEAAPYPQPLAAPAPPRTYPGVWQAIGLLILLGVLETAFGLTIRSVDKTLRKAPAVDMLVDLLGYSVVLFWGLRRSAAPARVVFPFKAFRPALFVASLLILFGAGFLLLETGYLLSQVLPKPESVRAVDREMRAGGVRAIHLVLVGPVLEELLFRGLILRGFLGNYSMRRAVLLSALLFAVFHLSPWQFVPTFVIGLLFGWWRAQTGSLWPGVLGHMVYNAVPTAMAALGRAVPARSHAVNLVLSGSIQAVLLALAALFIAAGILLLRRLEASPRRFVLK